MRKSDNQSEKFIMAQRLQQVRTNLGLTQQKFADILDISLSAYKKIESGENGVSLNSLRILNKELGVSADYILFGEQPDLADVWKEIVSCSDKDKLYLMMQLFRYFAQEDKIKFSALQEKTPEMDNAIMEFLNKVDLSKTQA